MNYSFGTPINNSIYSVNPFNNFFTADISDKNMIYHYVGNQNIYSLSTFMKNGKVAVGKRHNTMKYHMFVIRNMYPNISISEMVSKLRWLVNLYYTNPFEITDEEIYRMSASVLKMGIKTETGKRKYILNPDYKYLTKSEKIKSFQKCKSLHTKDTILSGVDLSKSYTELSKELGYSTATIKKYLKIEGIDLVKLKAEEKFEMFKAIYSQPENQAKSGRELARLTGISNSQINRYINQLKK
jgi:biotin operon repressor